MDMDMDMDMDMSDAGMFTPANMRVAHIYWYLIVTVIGILAARRMMDWIRILIRKRRSYQYPRSAIRFGPGNWLTQVYDTLIAICREAAYPQLVTFTGPFTRYFTPPSLGKCLLLGAYWVVILVMLWSNVILSSSSPNYVYKWEIVGFRAAWVSVSQLPLIYCLSCKINVISLITGISYERLNWLHRWTARTIFLTVIVHWSFFVTEWSLANFVQLELQLMPMVKYGFAAWGVIGLMVLSSFGFLRSQIYEVWAVQHILMAGVLLWLVHVHVPSYAAYNVWMAIGFVAFDRTARLILVLARNVHILKGWRFIGNLWGFTARITRLSDHHLRVVIDNVDFSWKAGQHIYICVPRVGLLENHPFTISSVSQPSDCGSRTSLELHIKVKSGFTRRLHRFLPREGSNLTFRVFVSGPWGTTPSLDGFDTLVFMATGAGISFTAPMLSSAVNKEIRPRRISFVWVVRHAYQIDWFREHLIQTFRNAQSRDIDITIQIFVTTEILGSILRPHSLGSTSRPQSWRSDYSEHMAIITKEHAQQQPISFPPDILNASNNPVIDLMSIDEKQNSLAAFEIHHGRPVLDHVLRPVIEDALGETGIFACGNATFTADLRNYTARTSDERAVHKGTGAHGLFLFTETYGW